MSIKLTTLLIFTLFTLASCVNEELEQIDQSCNEVFAQPIADEIEAFRAHGGFAGTINGEEFAIANDNPNYLNEFRITAISYTQPGEAVGPDTEVSQYGGVYILEHRRFNNGGEYLQVDRKPTIELSLPRTDTLSNKLLSAYFETILATREYKLGRDFRDTTNANFLINWSCGEPLDRNRPYLQYSIGSLRDEYSVFFDLISRVENEREINYTISATFSEDLKLELSSDANTVVRDLAISNAEFRLVFTVAKE